jgi:hypothetical protein
MFNFSEARAAVEKEGVYIGGWSLKQAFVPRRDAGTIYSSGKPWTASDI